MACAHGFQGGVPGLMPEPVIVVLEEVEVEHQQGERRARRDALHRFLKRPAVVYAGQRIPEAEVSILGPVPARAGRNGCSVRPYGG